MKKLDVEEELISKILEETLSLSSNVGVTNFSFNSNQEIPDGAKELNSDYLEFILLKYGIKYLPLEYQKDKKSFRMILLENKDLDFPENWYCFQKIKEERADLGNSFKYLCISNQSDSEKLVTLFSGVYNQHFLELILIYNEKDTWLCLCTRPSDELKKEISKIKNIEAA